MKILFLGDIVGREARKTVLSGLPKLKNKYEADIIIINIENAAGGRGVTPKIAEQFFDAKVDILTTGNHVWDQREIIKYIAGSNSLLRPINMPNSKLSKDSSIDLKTKSFLGMNKLQIALIIKIILPSFKTKLVLPNPGVPSGILIGLNNEFESAIYFIISL